MTQFVCKKCPYFMKDKREFRRAGALKLILGFCRLRERHISDETINKETCKDRAVLLLENSSN
jgi:hypothetical protein